MTLQYEWIQSEFFYAFLLHGFMHFYCIVAQDILEKDIPAQIKNITCTIESMLSKEMYLSLASGDKICKRSAMKYIILVMSILVRKSCLNNVS